MGFAPFTVIGAATRHAMDINLALGVPSERYNARDQYRTQYSGTERFGAGLGVALGTAAPVAGLGLWISKGAAVGGLEGKALLAGRAATGAALVGVGAIGALKMKQIVEDDGHLGSVGSLAGMVGGYAIASKVTQNVRWKGIPLGPAFGIGGAIAGGIGGYAAGSLVKVGDRNIGQEHHIAPGPIATTHDSLPGTAIDFTRGAFNHFTEAGPSTQGISLASRWGMRQSFENDYSKAEQAGGMVGDLGAAALMGGGALAVAKGIMGGANAQTVGLAEKVALNVNAGTHILRGAENASAMAEVAKPGSSKILLGGLALAVGAAATKYNYDAFSDGGKNPTAGVLGVAGVAAAGAGAGYMATRMVPALKANPMAGALSGIVLISALSAMQTPVRQFLADRGSVEKVHGSGDTGQLAVAGGVGAAGGALAGFKVASRFAAGRSGIMRLAIMGGGTVGGAVVGGLAGASMAPLLPDVKTAGIGGAIGAAALGGIAAALPGTRNAKTIGTAALAGGALGIAASAMAADDQKDGAVVGI